MKKLNLGCGSDYKQGWVNVDVSKAIKADKHFSLDKYPWPFKENEFDEVLMKMVLEHVWDPIRALREVIRITKNGGKLTVIVPHATTYSQFSDLQHKSFFTEHTFAPHLLQEYELTDLVLKKHVFMYPHNKWKRFIPFKHALKIFFNGIYDDMLFEFEIKK